MVRSGKIPENICRQSPGDQDLLPKMKNGHIETFGFGLPLPGLPSDFTTDLLVRLWSGGTCTLSGTHPLASNNQFLPDERDFRGCGFISARLEKSFNFLSTIPAHL
jgi:hypothetical protein